jgi:hypothetical protein
VQSAHIFKYISQNKIHGEALPPREISGSQRRLGRLEPSGMWRRAVSLEQIDVSHVRTASIIRAIHSSPWWWRQYTPLERRSTPTTLHGATSQKALNCISSSSHKAFQLLKRNTVAARCWWHLISLGPGPVSRTQRSGFNYRHNICVKWIFELHRHFDFVSMLYNMWTSCENYKYFEEQIKIWTLLPSETLHRVVC